MGFSYFAYIALFLAAITIHKGISSRRNRKVAQRSGFPVVTSPVGITEIWWLLLYRRLMPLLSLLPHAWTASWLPFVKRFNLWKLGHKPFEEIGSDTIILSSPRENILQTCDPVVANQILSQHATIKMNLEVTKIFNIWGPTVGSTEGDEWKAHRQIVTGGLGPQTNSLVWDKAVEDTEKMLEQWKQKHFVVNHMRSWTSKLALHVISTVFFERKLRWGKEDKEDLPDGHKLSFEQALTNTISKIRVIFMIPRPILDRLPMKFAKDVRLAISEWTAFMKEMRRDIWAKPEKTSVKSKRSLLENIVLGFADLDAREKQQLPEDYALGNIFFTLLAGHETIGNTLAFTLLLLCVYPEWQDRIQQQLDAQRTAVEVEGDKPKPLNYQDHYGQLRQGPMSAVINETLRVYNVVQMVWRRVSATTFVTDSQGKAHELTPGMLCMINFSAAHRNPKYWSTRKDVSPARRAELHDSPALDFDPERWLNNDGLATDSSPAQKVPLHWPFSQGIRSCPGRGFATVEMTAVLSRLLQEYSLELEVGEGRSWSSARDDVVRNLVDGVQVNMNIEMVAELPIRIVPRVKKQ